MRVGLTYKEANPVMAILWELANERATVTGTFDPMWRLTDRGADACRDVIAKLEDANEEANRKSAKDRDLSGAPKGSIQDAKWSA